MTKPPKTISAKQSDDTSTISRPVQDEPVTNRFSMDTSNPLIPSVDPVTDTSTPTLAGTEDVASHVVVTRITDPVIADLNANLREIAWPALQNHLLQPHASIDGLYVSPQGELYAHLEEGGYYRAELNTNGDFQIPWPAAPGVTPPILRKIDGQSRWRVEAHWYKRNAGQGSLSQPGATGTPSHASAVIPAHLAALLTSAHSTSNGLRYDKFRKSYVDLADGTVMVRRNADGHFQETIAGERTPSGYLLEPIPGTHLWRRKTAAPARPDNRRPAIETDEPLAGSSKRPRQDGETATDDSPVPLQSRDDWHSWGHAEKPPAGDSIEMAGTHFSIVPQAGHADDTMVFITPQHFSAARFDAFEQLLRVTPQLQPRGVEKINPDPEMATAPEWRVMEGYPFNKPIADYVAEAFPYMSQHSANETARLMFNRANHSEQLNGYGLNDLFETFNYWAARSTNPVTQQANRQDLIDPLALMPALPRDAIGYMNIPPVSSGGLYRIDFDSRRMPVQWKRVMNGSAPRSVFKAALEHQGYEVSGTFRQTTRDALMFRRKGLDSLFLMLFIPPGMERVYRSNPIDWIYSKALKNQINPADALTLRKHVEKNKIFYLLGTFNILASGQGSLTIIKHD